MPIANEGMVQPDLQILLRDKGTRTEKGIVLREKKAARGKSERGH